MKKRTKLFYYDEMIGYPVGAEFICVAGGYLAGKIATVSNGFMEIVWRDSGESIENDVAYKCFPFVNLQ